MVEFTWQSSAGPITFRARDRKSPAEFATDADRLRWELHGAREAVKATENLARLALAHDESVRAFLAGRNLTFAEIERMQSKAPKRRQDKTADARAHLASERERADATDRARIADLKRLESLSDRAIAKRLGLGRERVARLRSDAKRESGRG